MPHYTCPSCVSVVAIKDLIIRFAASVVIMVLCPLKLVFIHCSNTLASYRCKYKVQSTLALNIKYITHLAYVIVSDGLMLSH